MDEVAPGIPVYLPNRTVIGSAIVNVDAGTATITIQSDSNLAELFKENLVGLSVMYMDRDAAEATLNKENN